MVRCLVLCASLVCVSGFTPPYSSLGRRDAGKSIALFAGAGFNLPSFFSAGGAAIGAPRAREGRRGRLGGAAGTLVTPSPQGEILGKQVSSVFAGL